MRKSRLGWLGPVIVLVGVAVAGVGAWYVVHAKPSAGTDIDVYAVDDHRSLAVRAEAGGERAFVELREGDHVLWQAIVPPYAGRTGVPGIAWGDVAVTVRVIRDHRAEIFALSLKDGTKIGGLQLAPHHGQVDLTDAGPVTVTDHVRTYEIVAGTDWHQLVAIDLATGHALWAQELGPSAVRTAGVSGGVVWVTQPDGKHYYRVFNGAPDATPDDAAKSL